MTDIYKRKELNTLLKKYDFSISKSLGQNFLTDKNIIEKIVDALRLKEDDLVIEIGPGAGALTKELSKKAKKVKAVEIDKRIIPVLEEVLKETENTEIINEDFMNTDLKELAKEDPYLLVGNLPYYLTTPILMKVLEGDRKPCCMVFMVQKEVAQRLSAVPGTKDYGAITVVAGYYCKLDYLFTVSKEVFVPKPKVDSAVISMHPYKKPPVEVLDEEIFFRIIRAGFGQRRKTLRNSLKQIKMLNTSKIDDILNSAGINPIRRAETLDISEFALLSNTVTLMLNKKR